MRLILIHVAGDCSLRMTALRAGQAGLCDLSDVAVHLRLRGSAEWLGWLVSDGGKPCSCVTSSAVHSMAPCAWLRPLPTGSRAAPA